MRLQNPIIFAIKENRFQVVIAFVAIVIGVVLFLNFRGSTDHWGDWLEPYVSIVLVLVAVAIWFNEQKEEWEKSLPKKLNAKFVINHPQTNIPVTIMECLNTVLINESDIRAWGQQIGSQMANGEQLKFSLFLEISKPDRKNYNGEETRFYDLVMYLKSVPAKYGKTPRDFNPRKGIRWEFINNVEFIEKEFDINLPQTEPTILDMKRP
jgi:hypothetical protein